MTGVEINQNEQFLLLPQHFQFSTYFPVSIPTIIKKIGYVLVYIFKEFAANLSYVG